MLEVKDLDIIINDRYIVRNLSFTLNNRERLAIIGEEGNGKSTLLKVILGRCSYAEYKGTINTHGANIGYLEQSINDNDLEKKVHNYLFKDEGDYYEKINKLYRYLDELKIDDRILDKYMKNLSGGEKVKIEILELLLDDNDILLLDEPTNDLDIDTLNWLEEFLNNSNKPIMYISHDEILLESTATSIIHLESIRNKSDARTTFARIDYKNYVKNRLSSIDKQNRLAKSEKREFEKAEEKLRRIMEKVEHQQNTISRQDPFGAKKLKVKMHSLKSQEKRLDNKELTEKVDIEESINFFFEDVSIPKNKIILKLDLKELKIDDRVLSRNIKLDVIGNTHLCIIGHNGVGKTTLIKMIYDELRLREDIKVGYMPQMYDDILSSYDTVLDFIGTKDINELTRARMYLGNMNFTRDEMTGKIKDLSNGSKAKLFLVKLVLDRCNVLVLDEPTRNVSPLSNPVIRKVLKEFKGTIISISHDRKYIDVVIDELYELTSNGLFKISR